MKTFTDDITRQTKKAAKKLRDFNHTLRKNMLEYLAQKETMVTELYVHFRIEQSVASQHLKILRDAGLVKTRRDGKCIFYRTNEEAVEALYKNALIMNNN